MPWHSSDRSQRLPANWPSLRIQVLRRDRWKCQIALRGCLRKATEVDHITPGDNHSTDNLRAACSMCHAKKSSAEGLARRRELRSRRIRPTERHPGMRTGQAPVCTNPGG
ncbi:HNH endonuclease [Nocardia farcinica]|uniref:HNH endonuclease n=1 Tax=Nocardia farcinica TaxID=37329 RepID=UPI000E1BADE9|nr:HNH endonuclease signature motif containing protein [Nocardia farcinica]